VPTQAKVTAWVKSQEAVIKPWVDPAEANAEAGKAAEAAEAQRLADEAAAAEAQRLADEAAAAAEAQRLADEAAAAAAAAKKTK
jgi:hypothetical protein